MCHFSFLKYILPYSKLIYRSCCVYFETVVLFFYLRLKKGWNISFIYSGSTMAVNDHGDSFRRLLSSCQYLEKVVLISFRGLTERDLRALTLCSNLKQLDLLGVLSLTSEICYIFFENCPKLEMIDLSICDNIIESLIQQWQQKYRHVAIKRIKCNERVNVTEIN